MIEHWLYKIFLIFMRSRINKIYQNNKNLICYFTMQGVMIIIKRVFFI